ncbi:hypothetical protein Val02_43440 [Virgisporangium aliadipatigenens]|uniref:SCO6045-like C-terminal domain-containing protein n=1 Tax=Virgisporangium aliadipatigenens TaxID=741659 RepID=A0A8J4DS43_9ACTN|nr:hypothetical protein [Virgisporangium aliadipatigenens]GIJ47458.1 hypothetical protein Val02_43440 [Virgisporangium aliadipatigenens]
MSGNALGDARQRLAAKQTALAAALVAGAPTPDGFDERRVAIARSALLNKRAGEVAHTWPALAASLGPQWRTIFRGWAAGRPPRGSLRDGFDLARELAVTRRLPEAAVAELAEREGHFYYDGIRPPRHRRWTPSFVRTPLGRLRVQLMSRAMPASAASDEVPGTK